jgi:hypothetical protein
MGDGLIRTKTPFKRLKPIGTEFLFAGFAGGWVGLGWGKEKIKEIESETELEISKSQSASAARQKVALELAQQLQHLKLTNSKSNQRGLEEWRKRMLDGVEKQEHTKPKEEQANGAYL